MGNAALCLIDPECDNQFDTLAKKNLKTKLITNTISEGEQNSELSRNRSKSQSNSSSLSLTQSLTMGPEVEYACPDEVSIPSDGESSEFQSWSPVSSASKSEEHHTSIDLPLGPKSRSREDMDDNIFKFHVMGAARCYRRTSELDLGMSIYAKLIYSDKQLNASFKEDRSWLL
eukprot:CAMPEP_0201565836 /NCGR_PEP_ID=MMETSP0190_2-20130828/5258_1 /ASSEMBLY_ACC=CAM_ASM_000263 /TAXON_ID=37353 /ORGANISM="Rosalina sp." /LENGTH=172 /DNA_ID=CAMNT_0047983795 /DNA_START=69 /DNA_END=587 /DNA_ORIENTATION=-